MHICTVIKDTVQSLETEQNKYVFKRDLDDDSTLQHNTLHFFCLHRPPPNRRNNLTDSMFT